VTIQVSVLIWTIICFCLMMLILNRFLFKPLLAVMDARRDKIEQARAKKAADERTAAELEAKFAADMEQAKKDVAEETQRLIATSREDAEKNIAAAHAARAERLESCSAALTKESDELLVRLDADLDKLADMFVSRLVG